MEKIGLVLEGGGMRGAYTAGVLAWMGDHGIHFDFGTGISSGALYLCCFYMNNQEVAHAMAVDYASDENNVGLKAFLKEGHYVAYRYMFKELLLKKVGLDVRPLKKNNPDIAIGAYDLEQGKTVFYQAKDLDEDLDLLMASCALPVASAVVKYQGKRLMDGGISVMIPIEESIRNGCTKHLVISTKVKGYVRKPSSLIVRLLMKLLYPYCPQMAKDYKVRHLNFHKQMDIVNDLVEEKKAFLIQPSKKLNIARFKGSREELQKMYDLGYQDASNLENQILEFLKKE